MRLKDNFVCSKENGLIVIFDIFKEEFVKLNSTASMIFENLDKTEKEIADIISDNFIDAPKECLKDIKEMKLILLEKFYDD